QAEDGIRDDLVTGVQTCALPICRGVPLPPLSQLWLEVLVADRVSRRPQVGELEKQLIGHIPRDRELADGREQDIRLPAGRDDHGAAVFAGATDRALTPGDQGAAGERGEGQAGTWAGGWHGASDFTAML